jgi:preprotein translocase subunit YajC
MNVLGLAYAMGTSPGAGGVGAGPGGMANALILPIAFIAIFYFLLIRPQQKRAKEHRDFLAGMEKGDEVVTSGGLHGKVTGITDKVVTLEIAPNVRVKVEKANIAGRKPKTQEKTTAE